MSFEKNLEKLETIINQLEQESLSLDDSLKLYGEAIKLGKVLIDEIKESKGKLELLNEDLSRINLDGDLD